MPQAFPYVSCPLFGRSRSCVELRTSSPSTSRLAARPLSIGTRSNGMDRGTKLRGVEAGDSHGCLPFGGPAAIGTSLRDAFVWQFNASGRSSSMNSPEMHRYAFGWRHVYS